MPISTSAPGLLKPYAFAPVSDIARLEKHDPGFLKLRVRGEAVCASLQGMLFEPCFHLEKTDDRSFRGSLSGLGFAYCDFTRRDITLPIVRSSALQ